MDTLERHVHAHTHQHYSLGQLANHLRTWHREDGGHEWEVWEAHEHFSNIKVGDNYAARIDVHPWAMERLAANPSVVFAGMEGCLKADSILSAILKDDLDASVYSFPSVTLGKCPELPRFAKEFLQDKTVIAVLDADWADPSKDGAVENQGRIYQARLLELGVPRVHLAAPPQESGQKGVDDFLGVSSEWPGGHLSELVCIDVEPPKFEDVMAWVTAHGDFTYYTAAERAVHILRSMAVFGGASQAISVTLSCMGNVMGLDSRARKFSEYLRRFEEWGAVEIDGTLDTGPSWFGGFDWDKRPTIRLIPEILQAAVLPERTLLDVLGPSFFGRS